MRLERLERHTRTHLSRRSTQGVSIDEVALDFDMHYDADPIGRICLCSVHDGVLSENHHDGRVEHYVPGEIVSLTPPDLPYSGVAREATYSVVMIDPALLLDDRLWPAALYQGLCLDSMGAPQRARTEYRHAVRLLESDSAELAPLPAALEGLAGDLLMMARRKALGR